MPTETLPDGQEVTPGGVASPGVSPETAPEPAPEAQPEQPDAKEKAPTEPSESTLSIAKRFGGRIAWSQGDLAIIEGFQLFGSKSLYVAVVGDRYSLTDFTLMKPEQRKALLGDNEELFLRKREELVEANNRMLVQNPDGPFTNGQTVVVSKNVPQNVASVFREWVRLLGLSAPTRIVLTTPRDGIDMAAEYGGKFRRIGVTSLMSDNERGQMTPLGEDDFHIFYKEDTSYARTLEVLAHELGHILERQSFKNLPDDQRKAIIAEHEKWLKRVGSQKALDGIRELRAMRVGRIQPNVDRADDRFDSLNAYWKSFSEWFADQVARWATTTDKPLTVIEKFFARLGKKLREFFNLKGSQFAPNQRIADWLNSLSPDLNAVVEETLAPAEPAAKDSLPVVRDTSKPEQMTPLEYMRKAVGAKFVESVAPGKEEAWWSAKEKQEAPRRYAAGTKMVLEENGRFFVLDLNTNKYKSFGSKREAFLFFKAKGGYSERRYIEALSGKKLDPLSRIDHKIAVDNAVKNNAPVSAETVDAYGIKLPEGYVKQGELYVYEKTQPLPKDDTAGERGAVAPAPTVEPAPEAQPLVAKARKDAKTKKEAPKTLAEAEAKIAEQSAAADFLAGAKEEAAQEALRNKKGAFIRENATNAAEANFLRDLLSGGWDKSLDDISSGRVSVARADTLAKAAESANLIDAFTASRFSQTAGKQPVSQPVQSFRDAVSQMTPTAQAKWTPELRATAEAYLDSGGTTGLQGLSPTQEKIIKRILDEATRTPEQEAAIRKADAEKLRQAKAKEKAERARESAYRESSLPPTPGKQIRKIGKGAMESVPVVLDEIAKVIPNIRDLVEVRESVEGEPDAEGFYDPQADKAVVLVDNVYLKPQHGGSQEAALRETIVHELLHRGFAKLRQTNPQLFEQFEAYSLADTNDAQFEALVRRGYSMYSNWKDDPSQNQKAREEIFIRKAVVDLNFKGIEAIKSPSSLASQFFSWLRGLLNKLLGRKVDDETLLHWSRVFLNAAQADFIEKTPGERAFSLGRDLLSPEKYARHAELEAKHNAGTITPEETAEAQALVEEAAKAAGLSDLLFHGTDSEFTEFDPAMAGSRTRGPKAKLAFWFTESERHALERGSIAMPVFLQYSNPLVVERLTDTFDAGDIIETAKAKGHDAVIFERLDDLENSSIGVYSVALIINESVSSQIKSAERFTGVPLEQRFQPTSPDIRYSLADKDAEYLDAVEAGDMEKAQRMVDDAAKAAGYNVSGVGNGITYEAGDEPDSVYGERDNVMSHGGTFGFYFSDNPDVWSDYAKPRRKGEKGRVNRTFLSLKNPFRFSEELISYDAFQKLLRDGGIALPAEVKSRLDRLVAGGFGDTQPVWKWLHPTHVGAGASYGESLKKAFTDAGYDGVIHPDSSLMEGGLDTPATSYVVFDPSQIKSADPVTRDDAGNVIPLSQRFRTVSPDIRYSLGDPPDMQAEADALREVTPNSQALDKFRETFGTPRQDVGQVLGKKEGSVYTQAQVAPLIEYARSMIGFENDANGDPIISPEATQKALNMVANLNGRPGFASQFNVRAAEVFKGKPVDPEIATAVLTQELQVYANRLSASSPKAEDQILKAALTPFYNTQILGSYLSRRIAGRTLQAASMASGETGDARKSREEAEKAVNKEITKQLGDEALPAAEGMDKAGVEGGVDAIKDDIPAPADPTLRLLDLAVESLDEVAKAKTERVFDILFEIGQLEELVAQDEKVGNKAMSILRNPNLAARNYPTDPAERKALLAQKKAELATALDEALASLQGAEPETKKKVKAKAAKTKSKTDSIQKLIDKLSKMPDESKEAKPKAETLRSAIVDAIKEKEFDEQKVRDAATKFGATPEQTERLVEEAERIHEIRQSPKLSKAKLRQFLLSFPKNVLANPEQREALLRSFLKGQNYSEAEINRIVPQVLRDFDTGYQKARKAYLDELEKKLKPKQGQKESKQDQQNRKMLNALRSGLADTTSETSVALAKSLGFEAFRPQDDHILSKLDEEMRKLREQGRLSDSNAKFDAIKSLLIRRRPPRGFGEVVAQSWITSALSSLSNLAVNVWAPMGEAGVRLMSDIVRATALRKFDEIPLYFEAAGKAMKGTLSRFNFAVKTDTFTNSVNTLIAGMASMKDEMQRSAAVLKDKNASPAAKVNAGFRYVMSFGDYSRRILSSIDDTWYTALSSYVGSSNLIKLLGDAKMPKKVVEAIVFHANNDALNQARAEYETLQAVEQFIEAMRGKTNEEIDAGFEYLGLNDASVTKEQANYIQELVSAFQSLRLRSGATGDELIKRALKELRNFRASVSVRATELGQMRTKELVREALSDTQTPAQVEEAIKEFDENAKKAASFGMGLHRVEGVPPYDILGNMFGIVDAMGRQAVQKSPLLGRMIVGFFGIPLNLLNRAVWFTPYGLGRYFLAKWQMAKNPEEKFYEYSMASQRERTMRFTEAAVGTSMTMLLYALGVARDSDDKEDEGFYITLGGPSNKTEYDAWYARGFRKFSICYKTKSGSVVSVPYGRGTGEVLKGPLMLLGAFDDMRLNKKLGDREDMSSVIEYLNAAAAGIGKQATFLGAKNTAGAFFSEQFGTSTVSNLAYSAANLIPFNGLDRSISALALGPPDRSRTGAIWANIPIVRHLAHQPAINVFGDPWGNKSESALNQLWDRQWNLGLIPLNISAPLTGNQKRLYNFIGERLMGPSDPLRGALELRNGYLTDEEFYRYKQYRGKQMAHTWLTDLDRWRKLDDDSLSKAIAELSTKATKKAKDRFNYK